jgi:hypothetical protein
MFSSAERMAIAQTVADSVARMAGIARLTAGSGVEVATYYPGGKTVGVAVDENGVAVHVAISALPVLDVVEQVRAIVIQALQARGWSLPVDVVVEDIDLDALPPAVPRYPNSGG